MTPAALERVRDQLKRDEGLRLFPYVDTAGKLTIGYGRNLTDDGISGGEAAAMLDRDLYLAVNAVQHAWPWSAQLDDVRLGVLVQLEVNLGLAGEAKFVQLLAHCAAGQWDAASAALLDSAADHQEPARMSRWAHELKTGEPL